MKRMPKEPGTVPNRMHGAQPSAGGGNVSTVNREFFTFGEAVSIGKMRMAGIGVGATVQFRIHLRQV